MARNRSHLSRRSHRRAARTGFTLMEIIVVVTIIALLAVVIVPRLWGRVGQAKRTAAQSEIKMLDTQVTAYMVDMGLSKLDDGFELQVLLQPPDEGGGPNGPYLRKAEDLLDPWDNAYVIRVPGEVNVYDFDIVSYGADGQPGGEDDDADITN